METSSHTKTSLSLFICYMKIESVHCVFKWICDTQIGSISAHKLNQTEVEIIDLPNGNN